MPEPEEPAVRIKQASKRYGRVVALESVSMQVEPNELFALLGPNGAGKTTLIHILCTIHPADEGTVRIFGVDVKKRPRRVRNMLGVVFQEPSLDGRLTVFENLNFHGLIYGVPSGTRRRRIKEMLELVELSDWRDSLVAELSAGMKRRLEIARALIHDSRVLILDEPTVGLDVQTRERIWVYLQRLKAQRELTILVTTHYIDEVEICDRACILDHGRVLALGRPTELKDEHGTVVVRFEPKNPASLDQIRREYGERMHEAPGGVVIEMEGDTEAEAFVERHASMARTVVVEQPSLETVFLSLTGRGLRDQAAGAKDRMYTFAKQGGEHTR